MPHLRSILLSCLLATTISAFAIDSNSLMPIELKNATKHSIRKLFISPGDSDYWGADILGNGRTIPSNQSYLFMAEILRPCSDFDILALTEEGSAYLKWDQTACFGKKEIVTISVGDGIKTPPQFDFVTMTLRNRTAYTMRHLFLSPADSAMWGIDLLDEKRPLHRGGELQLLIPVASTAAGFDLLCLDEDDAHYRFTVKIDLSSNKSAYEVSVESDDYIAEEYSQKK